jgi:hypothetical protein
MDFLTICQTLRSECGISGAGPVSVVNQTGEMGRVVRWANEAYRKIQTLHPEWRWMRSAASCTTQAGVRSYAPRSAAAFNLPRFRFWWQDTFRIYRAAAGVADESPLVFLHYDDFRNYYLFGPQSSARPTHVTVSPDDAVLIGPTPDAAYVLTGDYQRGAQTLAANADVPEMPADYHMAIVYRAMMFYGRHEAAPEVFEDAERNFKAEIARLEFDQLPPIRIFTETIAE